MDISPFNGLFSSLASSLFRTNCTINRTGKICGEERYQILHSGAGSRSCLGGEGREEPGNCMLFMKCSASTPSSSAMGRTLDRTVNKFSARQFLEVMT